MRNTFAKEITDLASSDERVVLLSGDIGNRMFDEFKRRFPSRFYNCGVAEQNMIGIAAGLASSGLRPYVYTIAPFLVYRPFEQIRTDVCYHDLPVVIAAVGAGLAYAELGPSHHSCEDIAALRALPNINIVCPGDSAELAAAMRVGLVERHPTYLRLGKKGEPVVHSDIPKNFRLGKALVLRPGSRGAIISTGNMLPTVVEAAHDLLSSGIDFEVVSMHTVKPLDVEYLEGASARFPLIVTVEEHSLVGGLGSAVAEWSVDRGLNGTRILRLGTPDAFLKASMNQEVAREWAGLAVADVVASIRTALASG
ncbi:hypothetical protein OAV85_02920 [Candidatus Nanopelagicales bacterium]|nr:hypothetical protein [Candidatus Nanopelagicales bacterium]